MSITSKISTAIVGTVFGLLALGAVQSAEAAHPASTSVLADSHWGEPQFLTDDSHWG